MQTIFVQDSDESIREVLSLALESAGYKVTTNATCGPEILPIISREKPGLVLLDFIISGEDAIKMCQMIKQYWRKLPVLALSCNNNIKEIYSRWNFDGYIEKPFDINELISLVGSYLHSSESSNGTSQRQLARY